MHACANTAARRLQLLLVLKCMDLSWKVVIFGDNCHFLLEATRSGSVEFCNSYGNPFLWLPSATCK